MAITNYAELQASVASWLNRTDLSTQVVDFITLGEERLNRDLRTRQAEIDQAMTGVVGSRFIALPATYSEGLNLWVDLGNGRFPVSRFIDPALLETSDTAGRPYQWTIDGANLAFERPCDQTYAFTLRMLSKFALSAAAPTNTLLSQYPSAYLYAALCEAGPFLRDDDFLQICEGKYAGIISDINSKEARSRAQQTLSTEPGVLNAARSRYGFDITRGC